MLDDNDVDLSLDFRGDGFLVDQKPSFDPA